MKLMPFKVLLLGLAILPSISKAQTDVKTWEEYAYKNAEANDVKAKKTVKPVDIPEYNSLLSVNQSGDAVINIPVVNVSGRKLSLPININYTTNGIKVNQKAGDVGLGWNINFGSIVRDYGAFEPDYTYLGSEFEMKHYNNHGTANPSGGSSDWKFQPNNAGFQAINPYDHNRVLPYTGIQSGRAPDEYNINVPGLNGNSFWSYNTTSSSTNPNFVFSEKMPWKVEFSKTTFTFQQEVSRINEFDFQLNYGSQTILDNTHNFASAIAFYPYVKNASFSKCVSGPSPSPSLVSNPFSTSNISYEDYSSFTVTTGDGTRYVFGKPLRAQKYLIDEEPFWCTMNANPYYSSNPPTVTQTKSYGEFWKTEYVAEWLLTAVLSNDYVDVNSNGPDNSDYGDWIKIDYSSNYKEWLNFTQTDKESSLYRERAYVTEINTPTEQLIVNTVQKKDIDDDHFDKSFNRILGDYKYVNAQIHNTNLVTTSKHPIETRCYSIFEKLNKINPVNSGSHLTYQLNYATSGSSQELCPSHYYILDNNNNYTSYDPADLGLGLEATTFYHTQTKGKKTLTGLTFGNTGSTTTYGYSFVYGNNKPYDYVALYKIRKAAAFPLIRESHRSTTERWSGVKTLNLGIPIANSMLPWTWVQVDQKFGDHLNWGNNSSSKLSGSPNWVQEDYNHPILEDEMGYFPNFLNDFHRDAWSLSEIKLPYSGVIKITYENDMVDIVNDRDAWKKNGGIVDYCLPSVGHYNNVAHLRSIKQSWVTSQPNSASSKHLYREFYFLLNDKSGGLRLKKLEYKDSYNNSIVTKDYQYSSGHYTCPPSEYFNNYLSALGAFSYSEMTRHQYGEEYEPYYNTSIPFQYNEYKENMSRLLSSGTRIDNSVKKLGLHYYEYIDEISADGSKVRYYYGRLIPNTLTNVPESLNRLHYEKIYNAGIKADGAPESVSNGREIDRTNYVELLFVDNNISNIIGNYKTEFYDAYGNIKKSENSEYEYIANSSNYIQTREFRLQSAQYGMWAWVRWWPKLGQQFGNEFDPPSPPCDPMYPPLKDFISHAGYLTPSSILTNSVYSSSLIDPIGQANNPLSIIGIKCGLYSTTPTSLSNIFNSYFPWTISNSQMKDRLDIDIHGQMHNITLGMKNQVSQQIVHVFRDYDYLVKSRSIKLNDIHQLRPKSSTVTMKY